MEIYSLTNRIKFTSISERYQVPKNYKYKLSTLHSSLIEYVCSHYQNTNKYKQRVTDALNILTYCVLDNEVPPFDWTADSPLGTMPDVDMNRVEQVLGGIYLRPEFIEWDVEPTDNFDSLLTSAPVTTSGTKIETSAFKQPTRSSTVSSLETKKSVRETQKEDLYIKAPTYPQFDYNKPWLSRQDGMDKLVIYTTLPEVPTKQNEISVTTDLSSITDSELLALYPDRIIHTRSAVLYEDCEGLEVDPDLGVILPIRDYTRDQLIDNIIRYPHLYKLQRVVGEDIRSFYTDIEIGGKLYPVSEVWDDLPESKVIPKQSEYIKEYVVRRYILEEESGMYHKYPMYGTLLPYLTLFMPISEYIKRGYSDTTNIVKQCVSSRVSFKQSRNPILRRLRLDV